MRCKLTAYEALDSEQWKVNLVPIRDDTPHPFPLAQKLPCVLGSRIHCSVLSGGFGKELICANQAVGLEVGNKKCRPSPSTFPLLHFSALFYEFGSWIAVLRFYRISCICKLLLEGSQGRTIREMQSVCVLSARAPIKRPSRPQWKNCPPKKQDWVI